MFASSSPGIGQSPAEARGRTRGSLGRAFVVGTSARLEAHLTCSQPAARGALGDMVATKSLGHDDRRGQSDNAEAIPDGGLGDLSRVPHDDQKVKISFALGIVGAFGAG